MSYLVETQIVGFLTHRLIFTFSNNDYDNWCVKESQLDFHVTDLFQRKHVNKIYS